MLLLLHLKEARGLQICDGYQHWSRGFYGLFGLLPFGGHGTWLITKIWEISMRAQSLRCLKSKYLSFVSAQWGSRYPGRDVIGLALILCFWIRARCRGTSPYTVRLVENQVPSCSALVWGNCTFNLIPVSLRGHHHSERAAIPKCTVCRGPHESFSSCNLMWMQSRTRKHLPTADSVVARQ